MRMPLKRWLENIIVSIFLLTFASSVFADQITDAKDAGNQSGNTALGSFGSKEGIRQNISNPMTSSGTQMRTLDNSVSFPGELTCPSSSRFLEVFIQPSPTGDLSQVIVGQDIDMEGSIDYSYRVPFPVSGICANGVISCDSGTWSNCRYYKWAADSSYRVGIQETEITDLGGCYCINNSCGNDLVWTNLSVILKDLGGGVVGAIQARNPQYAVSDVKIDGTSITYYGQRTGSCETSGGGSGVADPQKYYENWAALNNDAETTVISQSGDPDSYYNLITQSLPAQQNPSDMRTCSIKRVVSVTPHEKTVGYDLKFYVGWDQDGGSKECFWAKHNATCQDVWSCPGDWSTCKNTNKNKLNHIASRIIGDVTGHLPPAPNHVCPGNPNPFTPTVNCISSELKNSYGTGSNPGCYGSDNNSTHEFWNYWCYTETPEKGIPVISEYPLLKQRWDTIQEGITDQCQGYEDDPTCRLKEEIVDGVYTYRNFNPTGLTPLPSCRDFTGYEIHTICRDWWEKKRTYLCQVQGWDFNDAQKRMARITSTATDNTTSLYYQDLRKDDNGNWINESNTISLPPRDPYSDCERACKTKKPSTNTQAGVTGNAAEYQTSTITYDFFYKSCVNNTCPLVAGEEMVKDCQCINDFAEAASIMESLKEASKDIICSEQIDDQGNCLGQIYIFNGKSGECRTPGVNTTFFNCCSNNEGSFLFFEKYCKEEEWVTNAARDADRCHYIDEYCKTEWPIVGCVQEAKVYCCFKSKLGRIIQEQGRLQLKKFAPDGQWGSAEDPNCVGFTPEEFQMLDLSKMDLSEYFADIQTKAAEQIQQNMQDKVNEFYQNTR